MVLDQSWVELFGLQQGIICLKWSVKMLELQIPLHRKGADGYGRLLTHLSVAQQNSGSVATKLTSASARLPM